MGLLAQTAEPVREVLGVKRIAVVADRGHFKIEDIEACEKAGIEPHVPRPQRGPAVRAGLFRKDEFSYGDHPTISLSGRVDNCKDGGAIAVAAGAEYTQLLQHPRDDCPGRR